LLLDDPPPHPLFSARAQALQPWLAFGPRILVIGRRATRRGLGGGFEDGTQRVAHFGAHDAPAVEEYFAEVKTRTDKALVSAREFREGLRVHDKGGEVVSEPRHHRPVPKGFVSEAGQIRSCQVKIHLPKWHASQLHRTERS